MTQSEREKFKEKKKILKERKKGIEEEMKEDYSSPAREKRLDELATVIQWIGFLEECLEQDHKRKNNS